jgi:hypothetical protein
VDRKLVEMTARPCITILALLWASPYTLLGLALGIVGLCTGGRARIRGRTIEFYGGGVKWFLQHLSSGQFTLALTLGHNWVSVGSERFCSAPLSVFSDAHDPFELARW